MLLSVINVTSELRQPCLVNFKVESDSNIPYFLIQHSLNKFPIKNSISYGLDLF